MNLVSIPANPVPDGAVAGTLKTPDGVALRFARWPPPPGRKGTVCIFQGRGEFIEKYFETVRDLRARGFAVATLDWRGQGLSHRALPDRAKAMCATFRNIDIDLETFMKEVVLPDCPPPVFALGHSMGATLLAARSLRGHRWFDRIVLSAPMIALHGNALAHRARHALRLLRLLRSRLRRDAASRRCRASFDLRPFAGNILTSDPVRYARNAAILEAEPALAPRSPDSRLGRRRLPRHAHALRSRAFRRGSASRSSSSPPAVTPWCRMPAIEEFCHAAALPGRISSCPAPSTSLLMEQDRFRAQFWAAFDAFVPGTPLVLIRACVSTRCCGRDAGRNDRSPRRLPAAPWLRHARPAVAGGDDASAE